MLKREHIKSAIDAIARRDPEIGYTLDEMFGARRIDALPINEAVSDNGDFLFHFDNQLLTVRRFLFFNEGSAPIEQQLLIKYGEMLKKQQILDRRGGMDYRLAAEQTRYAGLEFLVNYEIDLLLNDGVDCEAATTDRLRDLKKEFTQQYPAPLMTPLMEEDTGQALFRGTLAGKMPAVFLPFPYCRKALVQLAELNLEFFHVRFVLDLPARGNHERLFACLVDGYLAGLIYVGLKQQFFHQAIEIRYLASSRNRLPWLPSKPLRGVGSFLVAGIWMLWKTRVPALRELVLDSELGATGFYRTIGFQRRRSFCYTLKTPKGSLLESLILMADACPGLDRSVVEQIAAFVESQIQVMARRTRPDRSKAARRAVRRALVCRNHALPATTAAEVLLRLRERIPQAEDLLRIGFEFGKLHFKPAPEPMESRILIIDSPDFSDHLEGVFHMESTRRMEAIQTALDHPSLAGKWIRIDPRPMPEHELEWVHSREHIGRIAATAGKPLSSLDLDTQTTGRSYEVACLAAGSVTALIDAVWNGEHPYGFAFVRPPGHHAEPDRAMGFCLFNNVALAARYLEKVYGLERIMIVDIDAHHGNGTQKAFYTTDTVLFVSLHQFPGFPGTGRLNEVGAGRGEGFNFNIPLAKGSGDNDFALAVDGIVRPVAHEYEPEALLVSCGFDLYRHDRLAGMNGTPEGYALMTRFLKEIAVDLCGGRLVYVLEGGYNLRGIETCALRTLQELAGVDTLGDDRVDSIRKRDPHKSAALKKVIDIQKKYWKSLRR